MNIFALSEDPREAAQMHCDRHCVKMIVEYAQLLSTAHRTLDGVDKIVNWTVPHFSGTELIGCKAKSKIVKILSGESVRVQEYVLFDDETLGPQSVGKNKIIIENAKCYKATHANHPSAVWARESSMNYAWLAQLFKNLLDEYTVRYGRVHKTQELLNFLRLAPHNIVEGKQTPFALAMPDQYKVQNNAVQSYRNYYLGDKIHFARWTNSSVPDWFEYAVAETYPLSHFQGKSSLSE